LTERVTAGPESAPRPRVGSASGGAGWEARAGGGGRGAGGGGLADSATIARWVGLDSATNLEYVERPPDSAERGIGAHSSRIQRALGGLTEGLRQLRAVEGGVRQAPQPQHRPPQSSRAPPSAPASWSGQCCGARSGTPPSTALNCLSPPQWGRVALCNPPKARWIRELWAPIPRSALSGGRSTYSRFVAESSPTLARLGAKDNQIDRVDRGRERPIRPSCSSRCVACGVRAFPGRGRW
jgi:hypothetical protein